MIYIDTIMNTMFQNKKKIIACLCLFTVLFGVIGVKKYILQDITGESSEEVIEYKKTVQEYDDIVKDLEDSIATTEKQVKAISEYCENSEYMKIDSQNIKAAFARYLVIGSEKLDVNILKSAVISFVKDGDISQYISATDIAIEEKYIKELISVSDDETAITISVIHYDTETANKVLDCICDAVNDYYLMIKDKVGDSELLLQEKFNDTRVDSTVLNRQDDNLDRYKKNVSSLSSFRKSLIDQEKNRKEYVTYNKPREASGRSLKMILKYPIFGMVLGGGLPFVWYTLQSIIGDRLKSTDEILNRGISVSGEFKRKTNYDQELSRSAGSIQLLLEKNKKNEIFLFKLGRSKWIEKISADYVQKLQAGEIKVTCVQADEMEIESLRDLTRAGVCLLFAETGESTYAQLEKQIQFCRNYEIEIQGCVVIDQ